MKQMIRDTYYMIRDKRGFTLIEMILYVAIFAIVTGGMVMFAFAMLTSAQRTDDKVEVADNSRFAVQKLQRVLQSTTAINSPAVGASANSLSLTTATASWNPLVINVASTGSSSGSLQFTIGASPSVPITNSFVKVSSVSFKNYSFSTGTKNTIRFKANIISINPYLPASSSVDVFITIQ